ncbi:MAG: alpha/beta fold hydrolase [Steroidobacteraceae bacterium]|nr:alpha/beta fold hydrolase [Nevskiaceae bacterium]MCP5466543.1 alpha/beta fold hydrolase [Nevskiaceae bacterium]MCP5471359.1 alpha/beta fold hydrolase [Nevskiaceae bacterium]
MTVITRHYVVVEGRLVHYRRAGQGPLLLLLHQSPQSSLDFVDLMTRWADRFTMLAPDRPGCGQSEPLPDEAPPFDRYGDAVAAFLEALGITTPLPIYGFHTGAREALSVAARHPQQVLAVAANGISQMTPAELEEIDREYLPPLVPRWDGGHLTWLWSRMREQTVFFPWFKRSAAGRMDYDMAPPERTQRHLLELLRNWRGYDVAYRAAFHADAAEALRDSQAPMLVAAAAGDPLHAHLARLGVSRPGLEIRGYPTPAEVEVAASEFLLRAIRGTPDSPQSWPTTGDLSLVATGRGFVGAPGAQLHAHHVKSAASGSVDPDRLIVLHDATSSAAAIGDLLAACAATGFEVTALELPGHGESAGIASVDAQAIDGASLLDAVSTQLTEALRSLPDMDCGPSPGSDATAPPVTLLGLGAGATLALMIAAHAGRSTPVAIRQVVAWQPYCWLAKDREAIVAAFGEAPDVAWHGGHLAHAWIRATDAGLFHPWCLRRRSNAWRGAPRVDTLQVHERAFALLLSGAAGPALAAAAAADELRARVDAARVPVQVLLDGASPQSYLDGVRAVLGSSRASLEVLDRTEQDGGSTALARRLAQSKS